MNIYFVRHGESKGNKTDVHQNPGTPLSKKGKEQAKILARRLRKMPIDFIYSSPYKRAGETAEIISKETRKPIEYWESLHEMRGASEIFGLSLEHPKSKEIRKLIEENFEKGNWKYSDEETFEELRKRGQEVLDHLLKNHKDKNVLCISHGTTIKMIVSLIIFGKKLTPSLFWEFRHHAWQENTGITRVEYTDKYGWALMSWNDTTHL